MKRPQRLKQKKIFATKEHMISLIDQVCSVQDAVIQQKREQEGVTLKMTDKEEGNLQGKEEQEGGKVGEDQGQAEKQKGRSSCQA